MKKNSFKQTITSTLIFLLLIIQPAQACTIFSLYPNNEQWIGRNFDWAYGHGLIYTNKRNTTKSSIRLSPTDVVANWISRYGSVTFNQFGKEFPTGGMNEAGLVVDALKLKSSIFPAIDSRPSLNELQFIQYLLDNFATVESIVEGLDKIRLSPVGSKLHYFACDINKCIIIEFINGQLTTHFSDNLPISSLTNSTYEESLNYTRNFISFGGENPIVTDSKKSLDRFVRASYSAKSIKNYDNPEQAIFTFLEETATRNNRWQIIYNQNERAITFRTTGKNAKPRKINLTGFDFSCQEPSQYFDLENVDTGLINDQFKNFDSKLNRKIIRKSVIWQRLPFGLTKRLADYPNETKCN